MAYIGSGAAPVATSTAANSVNTDSVQNSAITSAKIADATIDTVDIADSAVTAGKMAATLDLSSKTLTLGTPNANGIKFPATQSASSDVNTLDDYEEGTWTPTDASGAGLSLVNAAGYYTKIGRVVQFSLYFSFPTNANANAITVGGLPFTVFSADAARSGAVVSYTAQGTACTFLLSGNTTTGLLYNFSGASLTNANYSGKGLFVGGTYFTT